MNLKKVFGTIILIAGIALSSSLGCGKREEQPKQPQGIEMKVSENLTCTEEIIESCPKFSSDGNKIFYISSQKNDKREDIYVMNADGTEKRSLVSIVSKSLGIGIEDIALSQDNREIAFISDDEIYIINTDGSNKRSLTNDKIMKEKLVFTPKGKQIMYIASSGENSICVMDRDGSNNKEIISHHLPIVDFKLSPDEYLMAFVDFYSSGFGAFPDRTPNPNYTEKDLYLADKHDDGQWHKSLIGEQDLMTEKTNPVFIGNNQLIYVYDSGNGRYVEDICLIRNLERLSDKPETLTKGDRFIDDLIFSPNEYLLAYTCLTDSNSNYQIYVMSAGGCNKRKLTESNNPISNLVFSPDGKKIAYESGGDIFIIPTDKN
jgi:Tol biopolymer transport system component